MALASRHRRRALRAAQNWGCKGEAPEALQGAVEPYSTRSCLPWVCMMHGPPRGCVHVWCPGDFRDCRPSPCSWPALSKPAGHGSDATSQRPTPPDATRRAAAATRHPRRRRAPRAPRPGRRRSRCRADCLGMARLRGRCQNRRWRAVCPGRALQRVRCVTMTIIRTDEVGDADGLVGCEIVDSCL
jgi:hypothetical protein